MSLQDLDINDLVYMDRLGRTHSVTRTAQSLGVSPSVISKGLAKLRQHFEDALFITTSEGMMPTPFADLLLPRVRNVIEELDILSVWRPHFEPMESTRTFRLMCSDHAYLVFVTSVIRALRNLAPFTRLECTLTTENAAERLRAKDIDFAIHPRERLVDDHPAIELFEESLCCVVWAENKNIGSEISLDEFLAGEHVGTMLGPTRIPHIQDEALARHGVKPRTRVYAPNFTSVAETVVGTDLIGTMQLRAAQIAAERLPIRLLPTPVPLRPFTEMLQMHRGTVADPGISWMCNLFQEVARNLG